MGLRNKYWVLRHGRSIPNENGLIVSSLENGVLPEYGLAAEGVQQAKAAGKLFLQDIEKEEIPVEKVHMYISPFSRTRQTAEAVATSCNIPLDSSNINVTEELRERYFGPGLELQSHDHYSEIWELDEEDPFRPPEGGESVADVATRLSKTMSHIEKEHEGCAILVVAHGDPLQILQTILDAVVKYKSFENKSGAEDLKKIFTAPILSQHRKFSLLTGQLRRVI